MKNLNMFFALFLLTLFSCGRGTTVVQKDGANGHSAAFSLVAADSSVCAAGGQALSAGVDLNDDGVLQPSETKTVAVVCNGQNGTNGANGINGTNATSITIVNLCPGVSNYGTFIEVAFCANNKLYAVYSIPNAFMTYIANGAHMSSGIGSACNLTVTGCVVTH